jgi:hypothetical protein
MARLKVVQTNGESVGSIVVDSVELNKISSGRSIQINKVWYFITSTTLNEEGGTVLHVECSYGSIPLQIFTQ